MGVNLYSEYDTLSCLCSHVFLFSGFQVVGCIWNFLNILQYTNKKPIFGTPLIKFVSSPSKT